MGYSYSNIQLKKGSLPIDPEKIAEKLAAEYRLKRTESRDDADVTVAIGPENADPWITIVSDVFDEDLEKSCSIAKALSEEYRTEAIAISCFDSDYLCLNLLDVQNNVDAWAACGCFPEGKAPRRSNIAAWKAYIPDVEAMRRVMREHYDFAEECLGGLEEILLLPEAQGQVCVDFAGPEQGYRCWYYTAETAGTSGTPTTIRPASYSRSIGFDRYSYAGFHNIAAASRGAGVLFSGKAVTSGNVDIREAWIEIKDKRGKLTGVPIEWKYKYQGRIESRITTGNPVELKKVTLSDGEQGFYGEAPDVRFLETNWDGLPMSKARRMYYDREILIRFYAIRKCPEGVSPGSFKVTLIPLQNPEGRGTHEAEFWG